MTSRRGGVTLGLLSAATFGTSGAFATSLLQVGWTPAAAVVARVCVAALVLAVPAVRLLRGRPLPPPRTFGTVAGYGVFAVAGAQLCYYQAVEHLAVAVALLIEYSGVLLVVLWMWARHGRRPGWRTAGGAAAALLGVGLLLDLFGAHTLDPAGVLWALGAAAGLAMYFVVSAGAADTLPPLVVAWGGLATGGLVLLVATAAGLAPVRAPHVDVRLGSASVSWIVPVLGLAIVAAVVAYVAGVAAARALGARLASFLGLTEVLFAVAFAWLLLGQRLTAAQFAGAVLVLAGVALVRLDEPAPVVDPPITVLRREAQAARAPSPGRACEPACRATP